MQAEDSLSGPRRPDAPRLIEWTGERCVPWAPDTQVVYEHLHRYLWAAELVRGRRVLDLASGEGFGAAILARTATEVVGVDIDERTVEHSRLNYPEPNLRFGVADARELSSFEDGSFGAVVAFEMIEHMEEQGRVLAEIRRVLGPEGLLIVSTPDRDAYDEASGENPFHVHELSHEEFVALLRTEFAHVATWGQRTITGSALAAIGGSQSEAPSRAGTFFVQRTGEAWQVTPGLAPIYIVAVASAAELPPVPSESTLGDGGIELVRSTERRMREELRVELDTYRREIAIMRARAAHDAHMISALDASLNETARRLRRVEASVTWQLFQRARRLLFRLLGGKDSRTVAALQSTLRFLGRTLRLRGGAATRAGAAASRHRLRTGTIRFAEVEDADVSIVVPIHAHAQLTRATLETILDNTAHVSYEVILIDDAADRETKELLEKVRGARLIVNETNIGYLRSMQRATATARGRWLVLCNNDIEVQPGWLAALIDCAESSPDVGVVTPKFIYPDGKLAEAGGIMWRDATGANYGRGQDPTLCHFEYRREVDYGSAAALMVRTDLWREIGGFDQRFLPMYYEDTDLCFEARRRGMKIMYEPRAAVIHVEGATAGIDEAAGHKRHQEENRPKFVQKWRDRLETEHLPNSQENLWLAANLRRSPRVMIVDHRVPTWDRDSGGLRMRGIIEALLELGCHVSLLPDNLMALQPYTRELQRMGVEVLYGIDVEGHLARIGRHLSMVILSRPEVAGHWVELVRSYAPEASLVYDTVDLHWLREARRTGTEVNGKVDEAALTTSVRAMRELELALIASADATLVVSDSERLQVQRDVPEALVRVVPNVNRIRDSVAPFTARTGVLFVGSFEHPPNADAAVMLVREVMPRVWQELGDVPVSIVGSEPPPEVAALAGPRVHVLGWVPELDPVLDSAKALVAPLTYGAGLKGKVTQALAAGLPVVTTPVGAEGLDAIDGKHLLIGEHPDQLAERAIRVLTDQRLWEELSRCGQELAGERCSPAVMVQRMREVLTSTGSARRALEAAGAL